MKRPKISGEVADDQLLALVTQAIDEYCDIGPLMARLAAETVLEIVDRYYQSASVASPTKKGHP